MQAFWRSAAVGIGGVLMSAAVASAGQDSGAQHHMAAAGSWAVTFDGACFATFDKQGGRRGETDFRSQNWFMTVAARDLPHGRLTLSGMLSAEPATVGPAGYSEVFQEGEAYRGLQVTDRQHPHDLFMQLAAAWRVTIGQHTGVTVATALVGEPALGPAAFMHRASSADNPSAPLSHHIFDSTHTASGVILAGLDWGPLAIEGSIFRGREHDEHRYDLELGRLDSWSARLWVRPGPHWTMQVSHGFLHEPEALEPGDQRRTNASASWLAERDSGFTAVTIAAGWNQRTFSTVHALLCEATHRVGRTSVYGRIEDLTVETEILLFPEVVHRPHPAELVDPIHDYTFGIVRDVARVHGLALGLGADLTLYGVPQLLRATHGVQPSSFHIFARVHPFGRDPMWNMTMGQSMAPMSMR